MKENFISGVRYLQQFMDDGSFLTPEIPSVLRAVQAINAPDYMDYTYLLSVSGSALRLAWQQGWAGYDDTPNQCIFYNEGKRSIHEIALDRTGVKYTLKNVSETGIETAEKDIKASIDNGFPVLLNGPFTVLGYREKSDTETELYGVYTFADPDRRDPSTGYSLNPEWPEKAGTYIIIDGFDPRGMDADLLKEVLRTAVYQSRTSRVDYLGDTALGISAFDALAEMMVWDESFDPLNTENPGTEYESAIAFPYERPDGYYRIDGGKTLLHRFWCGYCDFLCLLNEYENFADFLKKYSNIIPEWKNELELASDDYLRANTFSGELWKYVTPDDAGAVKFKDSSVRYAFAAHMLRAKIYTVRALERIEKLLS